MSENNSTPDITGNAPATELPADFIEGLNAKLNDLGKIDLKPTTPDDEPLDRFEGEIPIDKEVDPEVIRLKHYMVGAKVVEPWGASALSTTAQLCTAGFRDEKGNAVLWPISGGSVPNAVTSGEFTFYRVPSFFTNNVAALNSYVTIDRVRLAIRKGLKGLITYKENPQQPGTYEVAFKGGVDFLDRLISEQFDPIIRDVIMRGFDSRILGGTSDGYGLYARAEHYYVPTFLGTTQHYLGNAVNIRLLESAVTSVRQTRTTATVTKEDLNGTMRWAQPAIDLAGISAVNRKKGPFLWALRRMGISYVAAIKMWLHMKATNIKRFSASEAVALVARTNYSPFITKYEPIDMMADSLIINSAFNESSELNPENFAGVMPWQLSTPGLTSDETIRAMQPFADTWKTPQVETGACTSKLPEYILPVTTRGGGIPVVSYNYWHTGIFDPPKGKTQIKNVDLPYIKQLNLVRNKSAEVFCALNKLDGKLHGQPTEAARIRLATIFPLSLTVVPPDYYDIARVDTKYWPITLTSLQNWSGFVSNAITKTFAKWSVGLDCIGGPNGYLADPDASLCKDIRPATLKGKSAKLVGTLETRGAMFGDSLDENNLLFDSKAIDLKTWMAKLKGLNSDDYDISIDQTDAEGDQ